MKFTIYITEPAEDDLDSAYKWLVAQSPLHAPTWHDKLIDAVLSLEENPERCAVAPESSGSREEIRQFLYGNKRHAFRILFTIRGSTVVVVEIVHGARRRT